MIILLTYLTILVGFKIKQKEGHGGEGFLSDSFVGVASLSQAGSERRVSHDAGVDVLAE